MVEVNGLDSKRRLFIVYLANQSMGQGNDAAATQPTGVLC
jgi:hypothetical protein